MDCTQLSLTSGDLCIMSRISQKSIDIKQLHLAHLHVSMYLCICVCVFVSAFCICNLYLNHYPHCLLLPAHYSLIIFRILLHPSQFYPLLHTLKQLDQAISVSYKCVRNIETIHYKVFYQQK